MDVQLRMQHIARSTDENAEEYIRMYDELCSELTHMYGTLTAAAQSIIADVVYLEQTKAALIVDIAKRGVSTMVYNGRQHYLQANKSVGAYKGACEQQRKLYNELRLTPASSKVQIADKIDDEFNNF